MAKFRPGFILPRLSTPQLINYGTTKNRMDEEVACQTKRITSQEQSALAIQWQTL